MEFDTTQPEDSILVSEIPEEIRSMKELLGVVCNQVDVPLTSSAAGEVGNYAVDANYLYLYTGDGETHSWVRCAVASW